MLFFSRFKTSKTDSENDSILSIKLTANSPNLHSTTKIDFYQRIMSAPVIQSELYAFMKWTLFFFFIWTKNSA